MIMKSASQSYYEPEVMGKLVGHRKPVIPIPLWQKDGRDLAVSIVLILVKEDKEVRCQIDVWTSEKNGRSKMMKYDKKVCTP